MSRHEAEQLEMPLGTSLSCSNQTPEKRVAIQTLLYAVGGEPALSMFEQIEDIKSPCEIEEIRLCASAMELTNQQIEQAVKAKNVLSQILVSKLSHSW
jgi:hypothetical protein